MVRKPTIIMLIVLALLIGLVFYLQKNPLPSQASQTPSPTTPAQVFEGLTSSNITSMELKEKEGEIIQVSRDDQGAWRLGSGEKQTADAATAEQLRSEIAAMRAIAVLPEGSSLSDIGLDAPTYVLSLSTDQNDQYTVLVGKKTSIGNGYYVQVNSQAPVVVDNMAIETIIDLMNDIIAPPATETPPAIDPLVLPTVGP